MYYLPLILFAKFLNSYKIRFNNTQECGCSNDFIILNSFTYTFKDL